MRALTLVASALGLAGAWAATHQLGLQPQDPPAGSGGVGAGGRKPPVETFATDPATDILPLPPPEGALPFPPGGQGWQQAAEASFFAPENLLNLGFSFIVGLAVGFAFKIAFKIALIGGGLLLIALFALQHAGLIGINWAGMEAGYDNFAAGFGAYALALKAFMTRNLANAASFTAGLLLGFKI